MIDRHEPISDDDRAAIEAQAAEFESLGASPVVPFLVGLLGALGAAAGFRLFGTANVAAAALVFGGFIVGVGGLLLAAGRKRFGQVMGAMAGRLRRNMGDAEHVVVYEVDVAAASIVGGESDDSGDEWSGAVVRTGDGGLLFIDTQVTTELPRDDELGTRVPRRLIVRALPTHEVVRVIADGDAVDAIELADEELSRLAAWVRETDEDAPPCREIPAEVLEGGLAQRH